MANARVSLVFRLVPVHQFFVTLLARAFRLKIMRTKWVTYWQKLSFLSRPSARDLFNFTSQRIDSGTLSSALSAAFLFLAQLVSPLLVVSAEHYSQRPHCYER